MHFHEHPPATIGKRTTKKYIQHISDGRKKKGMMSGMHEIEWGKGRRGEGWRVVVLVVACLWNIPRLSCSSAARNAWSTVGSLHGCVCSGRHQAGISSWEGGAVGLLRLRGAGDMMDAPVVDTRPAVWVPPEDFEESRTCPEGEKAMAAAEEALGEGRFEDARRLQQDGAELFGRDMVTASWYDALLDLDERIDQAEKEFNEAQHASTMPLPPFWSASPYLNLTQAQVEAVESWVGRPLKSERALYLASEHGFDSRTFHHRCDKKGSTITLVRTKTGHIFGGYASVPWGRGELKTKPPRWIPTFIDDPEAFVFRLCAPTNWTGLSHDQVFKVNHTKEMVEPYFNFLREAERKAAKLHAAANAFNASKKDKEAIAGTLYENYTSGMFWSQFDEDEVNAAPGAWTHPAASAGGGVTTEGLTAGIMLRDQAESKASERVESKASGVQYLSPPQERDTPPQQERWGLDVTVEGISNQTDAMADDTDDQYDKYDLPVARPPASNSNTDATLLHPQRVTHNECLACLPPVWMRQSGKGLGDIPPLRHVWNKGPCFTHALELDLDVPENSFSDLLSGYIYSLPPGVPDEEERLFLAGKIGGRLFVEKLNPDCRWDIEEIAVIAI